MLRIKFDVELVCRIKNIIHKSFRSMIWPAFWPSELSNAAVESLAPSDELAPNFCYVKQRMLEEAATDRG